MIVVLGASGPVGRAATEYLHRSADGVRAISRCPSLARDVLPPGVEVVAADPGDPASVRAAVAGATTVVLASPDPRQHALRSRLIDAAVHAGATRVVLVSGLDAAVRPDSVHETGRSAWSAEEQLRSSGVASTVVRPAPLMQHARDWAMSSVRLGRLLLPLGTASVALVDAVDVGAVVAAATLEDHHAGASYVVTGPQALTGDDVAEVLSGTLGRRLQYVPVPPLISSAIQLRRGVEPWRVEHDRELSGLLRAGAAASVTSVVADVTGRPARTFVEFAADQAVEVATMA